LDVLEKVVRGALAATWVVEVLIGTRVRVPGRGELTGVGVTGEVIQVVFTVSILIR
jgi:hypothetical protein